jgi:hypothetical protein
LRFVIFTTAARRPVRAGLLQYGCGSDVWPQWQMSV